MTSGKFIIGESAKKDACLRLLLVLILLGVLVVAVLVGCYAFNSSKEYSEGCQPPELDPYGLSNWTRGAPTVAFGCFPGHQMEGHDEVLVSQCVAKTWVPPPPACAALPIALECTVDQNGIKGTISMWQMSNSTPTLIHGFLSTSGVDKGQQPVLLETFELSRNVCRSTSENITNTMPEAAPLEEDQLEVRFSSAKLLAYKKASLRITMVFIDVSAKLTATVVSVHQGEETVVMRLPLPQPSPGWSFSDCEKKRKEASEATVGEEAVDQRGEEVGETTTMQPEEMTNVAERASPVDDKTPSAEYKEEEPEPRSMKRQEYYQEQPNYNNPENYQAQQEDSY